MICFRIIIILPIVFSITSCEEPQLTTTADITPQPVATLSALPTEIVDDKGNSMRLVSAGEFRMGSDTDSDIRNNEHIVYVNAFYIDQYEVTNDRYAGCVSAGACEPPHFAKSDFRPIYYGNEEFVNYPVIYVHWNMAKRYCEWRGARLPTEAEWEKAARGTDGRSYPWGEGISCDKANYDGDTDNAVYCTGETSKVGSYESGKSPYGLYDMAGNVFEWVSSLNKLYPYDAADGREDPASGGDRVIRGGAWSEGADDQRVFYRRWIGPNLSESAIGFRCASSL
ncbi:MAG TPA: formylglycine-generating enzyme family protein [Anaerolineales bacterium]|nr:formylglycine-generating enzyme family protein [Anaerolineales bacterium]